VALPTPRCTVWWAAPVDPEAAPALVRLLDAPERERLGAFRRPADRARYLAAHALVRLVLGGSGAAAARLTFDRTCRCGRPHGKPVLPGGPPFSLSHAGDVVGVAVRTDGPVGLDVERIRAVGDLAALAAHVYSPAEQNGRVPDAVAFFRTWTRKEAVVKATADGLAAPMSEITLAPDGGAVADWPAGPGPLWVHDLMPAPGHPAAVAGPGRQAPAVTERDGNAVLRG
jgi:4'-phosphopantetheinyl transferase